MGMSVVWLSLLPVVQVPNAYGSGVGDVIGLFVAGGKPSLAVQMTEIRNANGREMSNGIPIQSSAAVGATVQNPHRSASCSPLTGSTMESEFVALAAAGKEAEWLRNLIHEIPIWPKPIAPISIRCDSAPKMAKAYSQVYNGKSRHLRVRHSMIRQLIMNG
ncbi:hypothetical protein Tco_0299111 [Tanacetum coccineum]